PVPAAPSDEPDLWLPPFESSVRLFEKLLRHARKVDVEGHHEEVRRARESAERWCREDHPTPRAHEVEDPLDKRRPLRERYVPSELLGEPLHLGAIVERFREARQRIDEIGGFVASGKRSHPASERAE